VKIFAILIALILIARAEVTEQRKAEIAAPIQNFELKGSYEIRDEHGNGTGKFGKYELNEMCYRYVRADGSVNTDLDPNHPNDANVGMGGAFIKAFERIGTDCFYNQADYSKICPNFKDKKNGVEFSREKKQQFLAALFGTLAQYESSCQQSASADCLNGVGVGFFMIEATQEQRFRSNRDPEYCMAKDPNTTKSVDSGKPMVNGCIGAPGVDPDKVDFNTCSLKFQAECAAATFRDLYCGPKAKPIGAEVRYWQKLAAGREVFDVMAGFPGCRAGQ